MRLEGQIRKLQQKADNTQQKNKSELCWEKDEMINLIASKRRKLSQKETCLVGKADPLVILQRTEFWSYYQIVYV